MLSSRWSRRFAAVALAFVIAALTGQPSQAQWEDSYENWRQQRDQRYRQWRAPGDRRGDRIGDLIDMFSGDIEPGQYDVELPLGINLRVNVNEDQRQYEGGRVPHTIDGVVSLAVRIRESLSLVRSRVRRFSAPVIEARIDQALRQIEQVLNAAQSGASLTEIRDRAERFDATWHDLETYLRNSDQIGSWVQQELDRISDYDSRLHRTISISPSLGYDRVQAAAVARRIERQTERLLEALEDQAEPGAGVGRVLRNVRDVHQQADDLYEAIRRGESYEAVSEEYRQFDDAWHNALEIARENENLSRRMWNQHQEIDLLDARMHDILRVESPLTDGKRTWVDRSRSLAMAANNLLRYINNSNLRSDRVRALRMEAQDVAVAAQDFYQWFEAGNRDMAEARARVHRISRQWRGFDDRVRELDRGRYPELFELTRQVDRKLQQLEQRFTG